MKYWGYNLSSSDYADYTDFPPVIPLRQRQAAVRKPPFAGSAAGFIG